MGSTMNLRRAALSGLAITAAAGIAGTAVTAASAQSVHNESTSTVDWGACPEDVVTTTPLECATIAVPRDYTDPGGATLDVMISRLAGDSDQRRGILMTNPGGPGGAGLTLPAVMVDLGVPASVTDAYDIIGMDPRGIGHSTPVSCGFTNDQEYNANVPPYALDEADVDAWAEVVRGVADQCAAGDTDGLLPHISTANTARDMDFIREALGEDKLNYFGASYGSTLGAAYASLFPEQSDRIIIDSNFGGAGVSYENQRGFGLGVEDTFPGFAAWAAERDASYGLGATPEAVRENYFALAERLDAAPVGDFDGKLFRFSIFAGLYSEGNFQATARAWQGLEAGDATAMRELTDDQTAAAPDSALSPVDNALSAYLAVACNDSDWSEDVETYRQGVEEDRERYPLFGAAGANISPCAFWHHEPTEPTVPINADGPQNVLILQNLYDNATPHASAVANREAFGDRARLVEVDAFGHGVYVFGRNACALNIGTAFLVEGEMPEEDVFCESGDARALDGAAQDRRDDALAELTW